MRFPRRDRRGMSYKPTVLRARLPGVKMGLGRLVDANYPLGFDPELGRRALKLVSVSRRTARALLHTNLSNRFVSYPWK